MAKKKTKKETEVENVNGGTNIEDLQPVAHKSLVELEEKIDSLTKENEELSTCLEESKLRSDKKTDEFVALRKKLDAEINELEEEKKQLHNAIKNREETYQKMMDDHQNTVIELHDKIAELVKENNALNNVVKELEEALKFERLPWYKKLFK